MAVLRNGFVSILLSLLPGNLLNTYSNVKDTGMKAICILANANLEQAFNYIRIIAQFNPLLVKAFDARTLHM